MNERIRELRERLGLSRAAFGSRIGVSGDVINNLERGRVAPKESILKLICSEFSVNKQWLLDGTEPMFNPTPSGTMEQLRREYDLDDFDQNLVYEYLKLDRDSRSTVRAFFDRVVAPDPYSGAPQNPEELEALYPPAESDGEVG